MRKVGCGRRRRSLILTRHPQCSWHTERRVSVALALRTCIFLAVGWRKKKTQQQSRLIGSERAAYLKCIIAYSKLCMLPCIGICPPQVRGLFM